MSSPLSIPPKSSVLSLPITLNSWRCNRDWDCFQSMDNWTFSVEVSCGQIHMWGPLPLPPVVLGPGAHPDNTGPLVYLSPLSLNRSGAKMQRNFSLTVTPSPKFSSLLASIIHPLLEWPGRVITWAPPCSLCCLNLLSILDASGMGCGIEVLVWPSHLM